MSKTVILFITLRYCPFLSQIDLHWTSMIVDDKISFLGMTRSKSFIDEIKASVDVGSHEDLTLVPPDYEKREFISKFPIKVFTRDPSFVLIFKLSLHVWFCISTSCSNNDWWNLFSRITFRLSWWKSLNLKIF